MRDLGRILGETIMVVFLFIKVVVLAKLVQSATKKNRSYKKKNMPTKRMKVTALI